MEMTGFALGLGAVVSVLAFGGVEILAFVPAQVAVLVAAIRGFWRKDWPAVSRPTRWVMGVLVVIPVLQLVPLPDRLLSALSPARVSLAHGLSSSVLPLSLAPTLTIHRHETQLALLRLVCYLLVFLLAFQRYQLGERRNTLPRVLIGLGVFEAVYGLIQYLAGWQYIFTYPKKYNTSMATGTYINYNHYAGLFEMALPFFLAVLLLRRPAQRGSGRSPWIQAISSPWTSRSLRDIVLLAIVSTGLVLSRSKMGIVAAMAGLCLVLAISFLRNRSRSTLAVVLVVVLLPATYLIWIGLNPVLERFEELGRPGALEQDRLPIWRDSLALIRDYPLLGTGLGTYPWASLHYQSDRLDMRYEHAHNDYLEFAADIGIPATVILFGSLWLLLVKIARKVLILEHPKDRILAAGCAGSLLAILTHEIVDFNLQIPANAFLFAWIAGTAAALVKKTGAEPAQLPQQRETPRRPLNAFSPTMSRSSFTTSIAKLPQEPTEFP